MSGISVRAAVESMRPNYLASAPANNSLPKYQVKIEINAYVPKKNTSSTSAEQATLSRACFTVYEEDSAVMRATRHALYMIAKEIGEQASDNIW